MEDPNSDIQSGENGDTEKDESGEIEREVANECFPIDEGTLVSLGLEIAPSISVGGCTKVEEIGYSVLYLPDYLSQGTISNRNGSSACTPISIIAGYFVGNSPQLPLDNILLLFVGCMEVGNMLHEKQSLQYMNVHEALSLLPESMTTDIIEECGSIVNANTVVPLDFETPAYFVVISEGKSSVFLQRESEIYWLDSHSHLPHGASIYFIPLEGFDDFFRSKYDRCYVNIIVLSC